MVKDGAYSRPLRLASVQALATDKLLSPKFARDNSFRIFHESYNALEVEV